MPDNSAIYIGTAFIAGVSLALIAKEALSTQRREDPAPSSSKSQQGLVARPGPPAIVEGIEGCIGNTPLFRIKSLSDETGCEILAKAEVCKVVSSIRIDCKDASKSHTIQFLNGAGQSSKDRVALSMIEIVRQYSELPARKSVSKRRHYAYYAK